MWQSLAQDPELFNRCKHWLMLYPDASDDNFAIQLSVCSNEATEIIATLCDQIAIVPDTNPWFTGKTAPIG